MAYFKSNVAADTTGNAPPPPDPLVLTGNTSTDLIQINAPNAGYYVSYYGSFTFNSEFLADTTGTVSEMYNAAGTPSSDKPGEYRQYYSADFDELLDIQKILTLEGEAFQAYIFANDDYIEGSDFNDKLASYKGNDSINPGAGNDKSWGGKGKDAISSSPGKDKSWGEGGKDTFWFTEGMEKETLMDFSKKKDSIVIDKDLAKNFKKFKKLATEKKGNLIADFGDGDKLKIKKVGLDDLEKISFAFLELDA